MIQFGQSHFRIGKETNMKVIDIEGIGSVNAKKLEEIGISSVEALLDNGSSLKGRKEIAGKTGIANTHVLK
jgi:hypothetical protein